MNTKFLFIDIETTGLPESDRISNENLDLWPNIIQMSWIVTDSNGKILKQEDYLVTQHNFKFDNFTNRIHKHKIAKSKTHGTHIRKILSRIDSDFKKVQVIIGHNIEFDLKMLKVEYLRNGFKENFLDKIHFCTMINTIRFCEFKNENGGFKFPKLSELNMKLFNNNLEKEYNSIVNVKSICNCFWELNYRSEIVF